MASYLLSEGYKDAAAVIIGSTLESHLRQLCSCQKPPIAVENVDAKGKRIPIKADTLNADLKKNNVYGLLDQKNITAWLEIRNNAAHGHYTSYTKEQVELILLGVRDFIARTPLKP